ncbi:flagellin N-terminal helical domain-containing protein [Ensifer soli]|uniref:flagellin N-terminal helical domain-containing protein n=1 Tax=Ciceribacter sp. sgz301302 TaxID=3342379 RepID=UPI0035B94D51
MALSLAGIASTPQRSASPLAAALETLSDGLRIKRGTDAPGSLVAAEAQRAGVAALSRTLDSLSSATQDAQTGGQALEAASKLIQDARDMALASAHGTGPAAAYSEF